MSNYVWGSKLAWEDYLTTRSFVSDINSSTRESSREISMEISRQTREVVASNEALAREQVRVAEDLRDSLSAV